MQTPGAHLAVHATGQNLNPHDAGLKATAPHLSKQRHGAVVSTGPAVVRVAPHFEKAHQAMGHPSRAVAGRVT